MNSHDDPDAIRLTRAHLLRHSPRGAGSQGQEAVLVDVAQDLLLRELHWVGLMNDLVFKGGTALRKLYGETEGRFSLDLDFCVRDIGIRASTVLDLLEDHVTGLTLGPFTFAIVHDDAAS